MVDRAMNQDYAVCGRVVFLDFLRVAACCMVILVHACEFYYLNSDGVFFNSDDDRGWIAVIDGMCRCAVPLFVMASSYLLLPLKYGGSVFVRKRFIRIFIPFLLWSVFYAVVPGMLNKVPADEIWGKMGHLLLNFNDESGHLWFIYMLVGIYMFMPILSPWLSSASRKAERAFLLIWALTAFMPYLKPMFGEMWGLCAWNEFHALYYFSGFIGYVVLAHYIRKYIDWSGKRLVVVGASMFIIGSAITNLIFYEHGATSLDYFYVEQSWNFNTFNVAMSASGAFLVFKAIKRASGRFYYVIRGISALSYGIYLMHIFVLGYMFEVFSNLLCANPSVDKTGGITTGVCIIITSVTTFIACCIILRIVKFLPYSKYIIG